MELTLYPNSGIVFAPESPYWLVKKGRTEDAEKALMRLSTRSSGYSDEDARKQVAMMSHTNEIEKAATAGVSFIDCFRGVNLRRTEISTLPFGIEVLTAWLTAGFLALALSDSLL